MLETKLISIRVPVTLLGEVDKLAACVVPMTRSSVIVGLLSAIFENSEHFTHYLMLTRGYHKNRHYKLSFDYVPGQEDVSDLSQTNLITP